MGYALDAAPDAPDIRDRIYQPTLASLPDELVPDLSRTTILDQGKDGACTGFGLAAVVNIQRRLKYGPKTPLVSSRMFYEMARRFDEWTGEDYEGSSIRGALRGFFNCGVCLERDWPYRAAEAGLLTLERARAARNILLGAYYRVQPSIADMHAAIHEAGAVYVSARVHDGWFDPADGRIEPQPPSPQGGHAFAIIGYNSEGFWVQNSWGPSWGHDGIALWGYADWSRGITDCWVLRIGVPTPSAFEVRARSRFGVTEGGSEPQTTPRRMEIAGHFAHLDDGRFYDRGRYHSNAQDVQQTFAYLAENLKTYPRLLLYAHGGLNSPKASASRIAAMKDTFKKNGIYPFHFMYDTGLMEELKDVVIGKSHETEERAGGLSDFSDKIIEKLLGRLGSAIWSEMKKGAEHSFTEQGHGTTILETIRDCLSDRDVEIHLVGHSLGSIFLGHLLRRMSVLTDWPFAIKTTTLLAPACRTDFYGEYYLPRLADGPAAAGQVESFAMYCLNDEREHDDTVTLAYRKSLLYLVSNAFEQPRRSSILGMQIFRDNADLSGANEVVYAGDGQPSVTDSRTHGGFDNDVATMNRILERILTRPPDYPFTRRTLEY